MESHDARPSKRPKLSPDDAAVQPGSHLGQEHIVQILPDPREVEVGITAYVSTETEPFSAVLKKRYTDFLVNEILPNGETVHLRSTAVPEKLRPQVRGDGQGAESATIAVLAKSSKPDHNSENKENGEEKKQSHRQGTNNSEAKASDISEEDKQRLIDYLNPEAVEELQSLYEAIIQHPQRKPKEHPLVRTQFTDDRTLRAEIHGCIRKTFSGRIESSTDKDGILVLTAAMPNNRQSGSRNIGKSRSGKPGWADRGGEYLHFTLYKENKDTLEAISWLVRQMRVNAKTFQFAGTKDRRAVTSQRVSAHRLDVGRLAGQNKTLRGSRVGDFEYQPNGLELGDLAGNEFTITLRECQFQGQDALSTAQKVDATREALTKGMDSLHSQGYLNYYGLQRFGTFAARTDTVGLHLLKEDYQSAIESILHFDSDMISDADKASIRNNSVDHLSRDERSDDASRALALSVFKMSSNFRKAMDILPRKFSGEAALLRHLSQRPTDYLGALLSITRNLRLMYVHAYQSLVWNSAITHRMATYGSTVVEGDLVLVSEHTDKEDQLETSNVSSANVDADGEIIVEPTAHDRSTNADDLFERARPLSADQASSGKYTIFDIVLPLPGYDILYPAHESGTFYKTFMAEHGGLDPMDMRRKQRDFSLSGSYRKILSRIGSDWTVDVKSYTKDDEQFVKTDLDIVKEQQQQQQQDKTEKSAGEGEDLKMSNGSHEGPVVPGETEAAQEKIAAVLNFKLGSSQYATMALRELSRGGILGYKPDYSALKAGSS